VVLVAPYFVPGRAGVEFLRALRNRGVRVVILTDSLACADVLPVYAAYSRYRNELLEIGVELYEFKPDPSHRPTRDESDGSDASHRVSGSSRASLHAKVFSFDRKTIFVGSLNLDPRSAHLNTEIGVMFDDPAMAGQLTQRLEDRLMQIAWRVEIVPVKNSFWRSVRLNWITQENGVTVRLTDEPGQSFWRDLSVDLLRMLPIESQL
jgi:putative cardiolipin synthase